MQLKLITWNYLFKKINFFALLIGISYWVVFFKKGLPLIASQDWVKEQVYLNTLRSAIEYGVMPWRWSNAFYHDVYEFMANPHVSFFPDFLILPFVSNSWYF